MRLYCGRGYWFGRVGRFFVYIGGVGVGVGVGERFVYVFVFLSFSFRIWNGACFV